MNASLDIQLRRLRKRVRLLLAERFGLFGAAAGSLAAAFVVMLSSRFDALISYELWASIIVVGLLAGVAYGLLRRLDDLTVAIAADKRTGLKERLSTAIALESGASESALRYAPRSSGLLSASGDVSMETAVVTDAGEKISGIRSGQVFRHRFGLPHILCGAAMLLLLAAILIPMLPAFQSPTRRQEVAVMKTEGKKLVRIAKEINAQPSKSEQLRKLASKLEKLGQKMATGRMGRKQAMLKVQRLAKDVQREQDRLARQNSGMKSMEQAQAEMRRESANLAKSIADKLAKQENIPPAEALKKLPSDQQLAQLVRKDGPLTSSERQQLEQALSKYMDPNSDLPIPQEIGEAMAKLAQNSDFQKAAELMQKLAQKAGSGKISPANRQMLQKQLQALAKSLKGTSMDKFAKAMLANAQKMAQMSPSDLKKLANQMAQAKQLGQMLAKAGAG